MKRTVNRAGRQPQISQSLYQSISINAHAGASTATHSSQTQLI
jgi:hypothetical protein